MKRTLIALVGIGLIIGLLVGVGASAEKPKVLPSHISFGTNPTGSLYYVLATGVANVISKHTPITCTVEAYTGAGVWTPLMAKGEVELGIMSTPALGPMYSGNYPIFGGFYAKKQIKALPWNYRSLAQIQEMAIGNIAAGDSGIKRGPDIRGKRMVLADPTVFLPSYTPNKGMLAMFNMTEDDVKVVPVSGGAEGQRAIIDGRADWSNWSVGSSLNDELHAARGARFISLDPSPAAVARYCYWMKMKPVLLKAGYATGVLEDTWVAGSRTTLLCYESLSDDVAYVVAEALWNHLNQFITTHPSLKTITQKLLCTAEATAPYHPGAIKFYKEKGVWSDELEQLQKDLLARK